METLRTSSLLLLAYVLIVGSTLHAMPAPTPAKKIEERFKKKYGTSNHWLKKDGKLELLCTKIDYTDPVMKQATTRNEALDAALAQIRKLLPKHLPAGFTVTQDEIDEVVEKYTTDAFNGDKTLRWDENRHLGQDFHFLRGAKKPTFDEFKVAPTTPPTQDNNNTAKWIAGLGITSGIVWIIYTTWIKGDKKEAPPAA